GAAGIAGNNVDLDGGLVVTGSVTVTALQDIGIGVGTVAQGNVTAGGDIILTADFDLDGDGGVEMNSADLISNTGDITITGQGVVVDDVDAPAAGKTITIDGLDLGIDAQNPTDAVVDLLADNLDLDAADPINVETQSGNIDAATDGFAGTITITNIIGGGGAAVTFVATTAAEDADINLDNQSAGLLTINTTKAHGGDINIASDGAIQVNRIDAEDAGEINGFTDDTQTVNVESRGPGDITVAAGDVDADPTNGRIGGISADASLTLLNADGDINLDVESIYSGANVSIDSTNGSITDIVGSGLVNIRAPGTATLTADDEVGNLFEFVEVDVGRLLVSANSGDADSGYVAALAGTADGSVGPRYVDFIGDPPGFLVWNGNVIGAPPRDLQRWFRGGNFDSQGVVLDNTPQIFRSPFLVHSTAVLSKFRVPTTVIEYIAVGGGKIYGLPQHVTMSSNIDLLQFTDGPYMWDLELEWRDADRKRRRRR
ncbi:MAG: hypothetical protein QF541_23165, partial [Lentisphaeria bacterium]|nr:hypothetical protein [Lentisphaeria bacterium]